MKSKILIKWSMYTLASLIILSGILVVHIYQATHKKKEAYDMRQLSRIDFTQALTETDVVKIKTFVGKMKGVDHVFYNHGILVYSYTLNQQTSENVFNQLMRFGHYEARRYVVSESQATKGCPVFNDKQSMSFKFTHFIANL